MSNVVLLTPDELADLATWAETIPDARTRRHLLRILGKMRQCSARRAMGGAGSPPLLRKRMDNATE